MAVVVRDLTSDRVACLVLNTADNPDVRRDTAIWLDLPMPTQYQNGTVRHQREPNYQTPAT